MHPWYIDRVGTLSALFTADKRIPILSELYVCREFIDRVGTLSTRFNADKRIPILSKVCPLIPAPIHYGTSPTRGALGECNVRSFPEFILLVSCNGCGGKLPTPRRAKITSFSQILSTGNKKSNVVIPNKKTGTK